MVTPDCTASLRGMDVLLAADGRIEQEFILVSLPDPDRARSSDGSWPTVMWSRRQRAAKFDRACKG